MHFGDTLDNANKSVTARRAGRERSAALGLQGLDPSGGGMGQLERGGGSGEVPRLSPQGSGMEAGLEAMLAKEEDGDEEGVGEVREGVCGLWVVGYLMWDVRSWNLDIMRFLDVTLLGREAVGCV